MRVLTNTYTSSVAQISDDLVRDLATAALQDNSIKDQLTHLVTTEPGDGNDINEQAFKAKHAVMPILGKVQKALRKSPVVPFVSFENAVNKLLEKGEITAAEHADLLSYDAKRKLAVRVDEFDFDLNLIDESAPVAESTASAA